MNQAWIFKQEYSHWTGINYQLL